jgi:hypothetical protein
MRSEGRFQSHRINMSIVQRIIVSNTRAIPVSSHYSSSPLLIGRYPHQILVEAPHIIPVSVADLLHGATSCIILVDVIGSLMSFEAWGTVSDGQESQCLWHSRMQVVNILYGHEPMKMSQLQPWGKSRELELSQYEVLVTLHNDQLHAGH